MRALELGTPLPFHASRQEPTTVLYWALLFFVIAVIGAIFGFTGAAVAAAGIAKILFYIFVVIFLIALIAGLTVARRRSL